MTTYRKAALASTAAAYALAFVAVQSCREGGADGTAADPGGEPAAAGQPVPFTPPPRDPTEGIAFVGAQSCKECHAQEFDDWLASDHHKAMNPPTDEFVLGDFGDVTFAHFGRDFRFYEKDAGYWVNAEDENGERQDYRIAYTFGHAPLQQYLIEFPGGRYQALQVCWDTRPAEEGGQRWFHLYPDEEIPPDDELHWTRQHFNWNYMCADCHSTDLKKNFDAESNTYTTTYSEMNVSCEACHGPGGEHVAWAEAGGAAGDGSGYGLAVRLKEPGEPAAWSVDPETMQPVRSKPLEWNAEVETCARCHAHRRPLQTEYFHGSNAFTDTHIPTPLDELHYHHDGQIKEEVYVYGSFVQSKMYHHGVRCTDCHHPHTSKTLAPGNALCIRCHVPDKYDSPEHHHHQPDSTGASCTACHMPHKYYMVVDKRLDHSIRIPRPDLAAETGAPDACTNCHDDQDQAWAAQAALDWWGDSLTRHPEFGTAFASDDPDAILAALKSPDTPGIARAAAIGRLVYHPERPGLEPAIESLADPDALVRAESVVALESLPPAERVPHALPLLRDPSRAVRTLAARVLAPAPRGSFTADEKALFAAAAKEYIESQEAVADRSGGQTGLAVFYSDLGQPDLAEKHYRLAFEIEPDHLPARLNFAEIHQRAGRTAEALALLEEGVKRHPTDSLAHEALGRFYVRQRDYERGVEHIRLAADLDPDRAPVQYFYGVALNSLGRFPDALPYLQRAHQLDPANPEYLVGLATTCRDAGELDLASNYADLLLGLAPGDPQARALREQIEALKRGRR